MKNILIFLFALISFSSNGQYTAQSSAHAMARFPSPVAIGTILSKDFTSGCNLTGFTQTGSTATWTCTGGYMRIANSPAGFGEYQTYTGYQSSGQGSCFEHDSVFVEFYATVVNASSYGLGLGWRSLSTNNPITFQAYLDLETSAARGKITFYENNSSVGVSGSALTFVQGEKLRIVLRRDSANSLTFIARNLTTGTSSCTYQRTLAPYIFYGKQASRFFIWAVGGTQDVSLVGWGATERKNIRVAWVGNSITQFYNLTKLSDRFIERAMAGSRFDYGVYAQQSCRTREFLLNVDEIIATRPQYVILNGLLRNDTTTSVSFATRTANYLSIVNQLKAKNINVIHTTITPDNGKDFNLAEVDQAWLYSTFPNDIIVDVYTGMKGAGTGINAAYSDDGAHLIQAGAIQYYTILNAAIPWLFR